MRDYQDLYLKCDVLLLADVFQKFINNNLKYYGLCPNHHLSTPTLSWNAMLNMTKIKLELISDLYIHIFFENGMRGRVSYSSNRYRKANNKYLKSYYPKQESKDIIYLNAKYLYVYAMSKFLPTSRFKWINAKEFDLNKYTNNSSNRYVLQVDLQYTEELQEFHDDYPLAPGKTEIKREMLSNYQLKIADLYNISIGNVKKLVSNLFDKEKYVIHYENLIALLKIRIEVKKENVRNRNNVKLLSKKKDYLKWTPKPSYMSHKIFNNDLVALRKNKIALMLNKPSYTGMSNLQLSEVLIDEFHYDYI